jgi:tryptophan halogenase
MNSAIAFPTPAEEEIPSWTLAQAMQSGWLWRIPTQDRWGNGYVFDDRYTSFEQAQKEVELLLGYPIEPARKITFEAGRLKQAWVNNCVAIGISSSFVEPLEASTIGAGIQQALEFSSRFGHYAQGDQSQPALYNHWNTALIDNILSFIALHYRTERSDTAFWQSVQQLPTTEHFRAYWESFQERVPDADAFPDRSMMFKEANWLIVMQGLNQLPFEAVQRDLDMTPPWAQAMISEWIHRVEQVVHDVWPTLESHRSAINTILSR